MKNSKKQIATVGSVAAIIFSLIVVARWWYYVNRYSVNILFWDQWDFYNAFFENKNLWEIFRWQHGPHRQGIGFIITRVVASLSGWDTRVEAFTIAGVVCLAMITALALRARFKPRLFWADVAIPLIFLTPIQFELFAGTPNLSHGSVPLLLFMLYCLIWVTSHGGGMALSSHPDTEFSSHLYRLWYLCRNNYSVSFRYRCVSRLSYTR